MRSKVQAQWLTALSWDQVDRVMERAVTRGVARRSLEGLRYAGLDEKNFGKGHDYVSVLHDLEGRRVLEVVPERTREAAHTLWTAIPEPQRLGLSQMPAALQTLSKACEIESGRMPHTRPSIRRGSASRTASAAVDNGTRRGVPCITLI